MGSMMWSAVRTAKAAVGVALGQDGGGEADGVGGVAADRFAEELGFGEEGEVGEDLGGVGGAGADVDVAGSMRPRRRLAASWRRDWGPLAGDELEELLGFAGAGHGPEAGAGAAGHDDGITHEGLREYNARAG